MFSKFTSKVFGSGAAEAPEIAPEQQLAKCSETDLDSAGSTCTGGTGAENDSIETASTAAAGEDEQMPSLDLQEAEGSGGDADVVMECDDGTRGERGRESDAAADVEEEEPTETPDPPEHFAADAVADGVGALETERVEEQPAATSKQRASRMPQARRERMARKKYERNANGTYSKTRAVSEWDYDSDGTLKEFASEQELLEHEEQCYRRRQQGEHPRRYESLSQEQQTLAAALNAGSDENRDIICEVLDERTGEVLQGLDALGEKLAKRFEAEQAERASSDERFALRELVYESLKAGEIRELLEAQGVKTQERRKWSLASTAAMICTHAQVQEFLASRKDADDTGGARSSAAKTSNNKRDRQEPNSEMQSMLPVTKRPRAIGDGR